MLFRIFLGVLATALLAAAPAPALAQDAGPVVPDEAPVCSGVGDSVTTCTSGGDVVEEPGTVGPGQVITDPADEVEGPKTSDDSGDQPQERGELHVLPAAAQQSSPAPQEQETAGAAPAAQQPAVTAQSPPSGTAGAKTLPFTGVDAGPLALFGALLLAAGLGLRRTLAA